MRVTRRQLRKMILNEIHRLNEWAPNKHDDPIADKVQALLDDKGYPYQVKKVSTFGAVNPFDKFDDEVIAFLKKVRLWSGTVYYIETEDEGGTVPGNVHELIYDVAPNSHHSSSGGFIGRTVFFKGSKE